MASACHGIATRSGLNLTCENLTDLEYFRRAINGCDASELRTEMPKFVRDACTEDIIFEPLADAVEKECQFEDAIQMYEQKP